MAMIEDDLQDGIDHLQTNEVIDRLEKHKRKSTEEHGAILQYALA